MVLDQNSCQIKDVQKLSNIDWSESHGLWNPCAGSVSPWGTHLGSGYLQKLFIFIVFTDFILENLKTDAIYKIYTDKYCTLLSYL